LVAMGHGLVLVLAGFHGPEAMGAAAGGTSFPSKRRVLEDHGLRGAPPFHGAHRPSPRSARARERHSGRRVAHRPARGVRRELSTGSAHLAVLALPAAPAPRRRFLGAL